jgi:hypothetical protein
MNATIETTPPNPGYLQGLVRCDLIGWYAIFHKDGWWVGTENGVTCYGDRDLARAALTIIWQREGGRKLNYRIQKYTGANRMAGEHTPKKSSAEALRDYEAKARNAKLSDDAEKGTQCQDL